MSNSFVFLFMSMIPGEKLLWFQTQLDSAKAAYTRKEACEIIERSATVWYFTSFNFYIVLNNCSLFFCTIKVSSMSVSVQVPAKIRLRTRTNWADERDQRSSGSSPWCQRSCHQTDHRAREGTIRRSRIRCVFDTNLLTEICLSACTL